MKTKGTDWTGRIDGIGWKASSRRGVVAAGDAKAVAAGMEILAQEGNAADAAVATILALMVTDHGACSIGGEVPLLIYDAKRQEVKVLCGQGRAPLAQEAIDWYMKNGIPRQGVKMAPVPSVVDSCCTTLMLYGTKSFAAVVEPALALLDKGTEDWQPKLAATLRKMVEEERHTPGSREAKLQAACDRFYGRARGVAGQAETGQATDGPAGDIADQLEAFYISKGGFLRRADLAAHKTTVEDPVTVDYRGYTICKCGPWTQGPFLLQALRLLEGFDLRAMGHLSADYIHVVIEAIKLAMADRDTYYGDPDFTNVPLELLLSDRYTEIRRSLIDMRQASQEARPGDPYNMSALLPGGGSFRPGGGGTTTCVVADGEGNVIAATPSANVSEYDGGEAGVTYSNRLTSFNTTPGHPNCIQPGKRPRITLTPTLVLKDGRPVMAISVAGADMQDQVTLNLLLSIIEFGLAPEEAVCVPRFVTEHHQDSFNPTPNREEAFVQAGSLIVNDTLERRVLEELAGRGHRLTAKQERLARPVIICLDEDGLMHAAGDPLARRHAAGL